MELGITDFRLYSVKRYDMPCFLQGSECYNGSMAVVSWTCKWCVLVTGSMDGDRIQSAQAALLVFLKRLPPGCYFNIVGFGSTFALLFPEYAIFCS